MCKRCKILLVLLSLFTGFLFSNSVLAQDETTSTIVNVEQLNGHRNNSNSEYRAKFYDEKLRMLDEKYRQQKPRDIEDVLAEDFSFAVDDALGLDFPKEKKKFLRNYQYNMLKQKSVLDKLYEKNILDKNIYVEQVSNVVEASFYNIAETLTDDEYKMLFGIEKEHIHGIFYGILNVSLPDSEKFIDMRENIKQK